MEAIESGDTLRNYVAGVLSAERQEYKRSLERRTAPEDLCRLSPISVNDVRLRISSIEGDLIDKLVDALLHSLLQDTTKAVLEAL